MLLSSFERNDIVCKRSKAVELNHNSRSSARLTRKQRVSFFVPGLHGEESFHSWNGFGKGLKLGTIRWPAGSVQGSLELYEISLQAV